MIRFDTPEKTAVSRAVAPAKLLKPGRARPHWRYICAELRVGPHKGPHKGLSSRKARKELSVKRKVVSRAGLEPATRRLRVLPRPLILRKINPLAALSQLRIFFGFFAPIFIIKACVFIGALPENGIVETKCLPFTHDVLASVC